MKTLLFNPFEKYSEKTLIIFGLIFSALGCLLAFCFNARFDGAIDMHFVETVSLYEIVTDQIINIFCLSLLLFITARYINRKARLIDILCTVTIARIPFYLLTFSNINNYFYKISMRMVENVQSASMRDPDILDLSIILVFGMFTILFLVWFFVLLWNGFKVSCNAKGTKHALLFTADIILAEVLSKTIIYFIS